MKYDLYEYEMVYLNEDGEEKTNRLLAQYFQEAKELAEEWCDEKGYEFVKISLYKK